MRMISKFAFRIDKRYQRTPVAYAVNRIVKEFDWTVFGALIVNERADKNYYVIDGGHRLAAVMRIEEIDEVPCVVIPNSGSRFDESHIEEARKFLRVNTCKQHMDIHDSHRAALAAGDPEALMLNSIIEDSGYRLERNGRLKHSFTAIGELKRRARSDSVAAREAFEFCADVANGGNISMEAFSAMFLAAARLVYASTNEHVNILRIPRCADKIREMGFDLLQVEIARSRKMFPSEAQDYHRTRPVLEWVNKRARNKIAWRAVGRGYGKKN